MAAQPGDPAGQAGRRESSSAVSLVAVAVGARAVLPPALIRWPTVGDISPSTCGTGATSRAARARHTCTSTVASQIPATFPLEVGVIAVATSSFGIKCCPYVTTEGEEHRLLPDPKSGEGRRARLDRDHPTVSRMIAATSAVLLVIGVGLNLPQIIGPISRVPPIAENLGTFTSPIHLPLWLNIALAAGQRGKSAATALPLAARHRRQLTDHPSCG
jgi:hypothetical protein